MALMALLKGKLSQKEDILTSSAFEVMKYLEPERVLVHFLAKASLPDGSKPLASIRVAAKPTYEFWPWLTEPGCNDCESDLLIRVTSSDDRKFLILVEVKYLSGKSSKAENGERSNDQLALQWINLESLARNESREPVLLYLTADFCYPVAEIEASQEDLAKHRHKEASILWVSWRHLWTPIRNEKDEMLGDLASVLDHLNLTIFSGFSEKGPPPSIQWKFSVGPMGGLINSRAHLIGD